MPVAQKTDRHYVRSLHVTHSAHDLTLSPTLTHLLRRAIKHLDDSVGIPKACSGISFTLIGNSALEVHLLDTSYYKQIPLTGNATALKSILEMIVRHAQTTLEQRNWIHEQINALVLGANLFPTIEVLRRGDVILISVTGCNNGPMHGLTFNTVLVK